MSKSNGLPSFPFKSSDHEISSSTSTNEWEEDHNDIKTALNVSFLDSLEDSTKFSYAGVCAETLSILYGLKNKVYCHEFVASFVAHLCLPSNVTTTMQALTDGFGQESTDIFVETLLNDSNIKDDPVQIANDMVMWALTASNGCYDARTRYCIRHITWKLHIKYEDMESVEEVLIQMLRESTAKENEEQSATRLKKARNRKWKRYALIGLATAGGGALVGLTGGLAAPLLAAGAGAILGGASAAALGSVAGIAIITSLFGAAGAGLTGYKMKRRVGGIDEFKFHPLTISAQPNITIAVSGWLTDDDQNGFVYPWRHLMQSKEQYSLIWESEHLERLGKAFKYIIDGLVSVAATEALKYTVLAGIITAVAWPATLISAAGVIDNPWGVCLQRAVQVGRQLAEVLLAREHGHRPVTLIGYSLGARVIFFCLEEMSKRKNHRGIIEDVYLLGAPASGNPKDWEKFESVVAGHITNAFSRTDWLLKFLYRTSAAQAKVAGLHPVEWENRRMINIDLSSVIDGHLDYAQNMPSVLAAIGVRTKGMRRVSAIGKSTSLPALSATDQVHVTASMSDPQVQSSANLRKSTTDPTVQLRECTSDPTVQSTAIEPDEDVQLVGSVTEGFEVVNKVT